MKATRFEFRYRWWVIFSIFLLAFSAYFVDHVNSTEAIVHWGATHLGIAVTKNSFRFILAFGAALVAVAAFLRTRLGWCVEENVSHRWPCVLHH